MLTQKEQEIRTQLRLILQSPLFSNSKTLSRLLEFIIEETLAGRNNQLKEYTIATQALGRDKTFNPRHLATVRTYATRLRKALSVYYTQLNENDCVRIQIPRGRYIPTFKMIKHVCD